MKIYVVTYEGMYGINGIECAFPTKEEALQYAIDNECFGCDYDYEEIELIQKRRSDGNCHIWFGTVWILSS